MTNLIFAYGALQVTKAEQLHLPRLLWLILNLCARGGGQGVGGWLTDSQWSAQVYVYVSTALDW